MFSDLFALLNGFTIVPCNFSAVFSEVFLYSFRTVIDKHPMISPSTRVMTLHKQNVSYN